MSFNEKLNKYLTEFKISSKQLSEISGISESVISRYRSGKRIPKIDSDNFNSIVDACFNISTKTDKTYTKEDITNFVRHKYLYNPVTINRCFDKFIKCGVIRINKDNYVILNDNFNVAKTIRNSIYFDNGDTAGVVSDFAVVVNFSVPAP